MDGDVEQDSPDEKGSKPVEFSMIGPPAKNDIPQPNPAEPVEPSRDHGPWKFRPWAGIDHWVHELTGASTFNLSKVK